jgi:hypothetical protein
VINNLKRLGQRQNSKLIENINLPDIHAQKELARKYMEENLWVPIYDKLL